MKKPWTETGKKSLEFRIECPACKMSNVIEGYDNPYWKAGLRDRPVFKRGCTRCGREVKAMLYPDGVEDVTPPLEPLEKKR